MESKTVVINGLRVESHLTPKDKATWLQSLRSKNFNQARKLLFDFKDAYCCLGVYAKAVLKKEEGIDGDGCFQDMPFPWENTFPFHIAIINYLAEMNDSGKTFAQIADWIEANL